MPTDIPQSKWQRSLASGKTAAKIGGKVAEYYVRKPFLKDHERQKARKTLNRDSADILFKGLSLLKGTALKIAQQLSLELDLFPEEVRKELEKSYHQVPPLNRALVRKAMVMAFGRPPERLFKTFDGHAFAAASLGQVHRATSKHGKQLAVKIQYPGIGRTIGNDIYLVKNLLRPLPDYHLVRPALVEIEKRLMEEVDYEKEADHLRYFHKHLALPGVNIPAVHPDTSAMTVLTLTLMDGLPLDRWIDTNPPRAQRDRVAQTLHTIFFRGLYDLQCIHADPNPGNFIIGPDLSIGVVDFGCIKKFSPDFVERYRKLPQALLDPDREHYLQLLADLHVTDREMDSRTRDAFIRTAVNFSRWFGKLFADERFDFSAHPDFIAQGRAIWEDIYKLRRHIRPNPEFVFLDRTRYGLLRIFEKMGARVRLRNPYEFVEA